MTMLRRSFITLLGGAAATWPMAARAQQSMPVIGFLNFRSQAESYASIVAFRQGLRETGFVEGENVTIEYRFADTRTERLAALAADLVRRRVAVIVAGPRAVDAAKPVTATIPIVFLTGADPVGGGLVNSLNRPEGNLTGVTLLSLDLTAKRFGLLRDFVPQARIIGLLADSTNFRGDAIVKEVQALTRNIGLPLRIVAVRSEHDFEAAFATLAREGTDALFVSSSLYFFEFRKGLAALAARHRLPASFDLREYAEAGGLMSYGPDVKDAYRKVGLYTGRILKGEKVNDLPVLLPTKFEFVINLKTSKMLDLTVPPGVLAIADDVIE